MNSLVPFWSVAVAIGAAVGFPSGAQQPFPRPAPAPATLWHVQGEGRGRPVADSTYVYFLSKRHDVVALDSATGSLRWKQSTTEPGDTTQGSAVVLAGSVVVAGDYNLAAFDRRTGAPRWHFAPAAGYAPGVYLGESAAGLVLAGSPAGRLYAVAAEFGNLVWTASLGTAAETTVLQPATDGRVAAASYTVFESPHTGGVALFDLPTGHELWRSTFKKAADPLLATGAAGGPIITDSLVIAASGDGTVHAFDRASGAERWTLPAIEGIPAIIQGPLPLGAPSSGPDYRPLALQGQTLVVGSLKGDVVAYDVTTRRERWRYLDASNGSVAFGLAVDAAAVYVPFVSGRQVALAMTNGIERWRTLQPADRFCWPSASDGARVYMAGERGGFVALRR